MIGFLKSPHSLLGMLLNCVWLLNIPTLYVSLPFPFSSELSGQLQKVTKKLDLEGTCYPIIVHIWIISRLLQNLTIGILEGIILFVGR